MTRKGTEPLTARAEEDLIPQSTVWLMAITVGVIVANIYYVQPLLADIARTFGLSVTRAGTVAMLSQAGTALGMFLFVPLGDKYERRSLIFILVLGSFGSLLLMGIAPNPVWLGCAAFAVGAFAASVHVVVPFAVQSGHVSNQTRIYSIDPSARSRLNMVYMFCYFIGGGLGSYLGACCWHVAGWWGVCGFGTTILFLAIIAESICGRAATQPTDQAMCRRVGGH